AANRRRRRAGERGATRARVHRRRHVRAGVGGTLRGVRLAGIGETEPAVIVQAASPQASAVIAGSGNAWTRLIAEAGLSAMAVTQSMFSIRAARALMASGHDCHLINCAYPDVTNSMIAALGLPITCGVGNIAILAAVFPEALGIEDPSRMKLLAHYQTLTPYRYPAAERAGPFPRIWLDAAEVADAGAATRKARITREPAIEVSGASGVPLMLAMASGGTWQGHVPGPDGRPGGYPAAYREGALSLELPPGLGEPEAVSWNAAFERRNGLYVDQNGRAHYAGRLFEKLKAHSPELAQGFAVADIDAVFAEMERLRARLIATPVGGTG
ncbi:MAG TPA: hypothetical protein VLA52_14495, partial [Thermohalobaculum sp.]|nr:hypothetical protein [Thermohalobaculum sp.]